MANIIVFPVAVLLSIFSATISFAADKAQSAFEARVHEGHLCAKSSSWLKTKNIILKVSSDKLKLSSSMEMKIYDNYDMKLVLKDSNLTKSDSPGEAILVAGRALITKNIQINENHAIDILDGAALYQQLVFTLIDLATQKRPDETNFPFRKDISEPLHPIKATTQSAGALFGAPWKAKVDLSKSKDGAILFKLDFSFILEGGPESNIQMEGSLSNYGETNANQQISNDFKISDWQQYNIGTHCLNHSN